MTLQTTKIQRVDEDDIGSGLQSRELRVGTVLWRRYEVTAVLGSSELGELWRCLDRETGRDVFLRWLPPDLRRSKPVMAVIHAGIRRIADQTHPNLAAIRQMVYVGDQIYLVGDVAPGMDLATWMSKGNGGKRTLEEVLPVLRQAADALDFAHRNRIIHRNLKPSDIFVGPDGVVRVTDFGLAPHHHMTIIHGEAVRMGTTGPYLAPELRESGAEQPDAASDQFALAVLAWELLAGKPPADASESPPDELPGSARSALRRAMSGKPRNRFVTCTDFVKALGGERVTGRRGRSAAEWRRIRIRLGSIASVLILGAAVAWGWRPLMELIQQATEPEEIAPPIRTRRRKAVPKKPEEPVVAPPPPLIVTTPLPVEGSPWVTLTAHMEFVWVFDLQLWVGRYEVTNEQFTRKESGHGSGEYKGLSLEGSRQPVVRVNHADVLAYAAWLTEQERAAGKLPDDLAYRLPSRSEAIAYTRAGGGFRFPWGDRLPPTRGNYADASLAMAFPSSPAIPDYQDGFAVTAPVDRSGENPWGLYGAGGNVWETTAKAAGSDEFGGWQGGGWDDYLPSRLESTVAYGFIGNARGAVNGFRLVLGPVVEAEVPPPPTDEDDLF